MHPVAPPLLVSERVLIRPFSLNDAPMVKELAGDYRVSRYTTNIPYPYEEGVAESWIASHEPAWAGKKRAEFAVVERLTGQLLGAVGLVDIADIRAELGYWIGFPFWGNGFCTEAASLLLDYGAREMEIGKFTARHVSVNPASGNVLRKLGMIHIASRTGPDRNGDQVMFDFFETPREWVPRASTQPTADAANQEAGNIPQSDQG